MLFNSEHAVESVALPDSEHVEEAVALHHSKHAEAFSLQDCENVSESTFLL